jgi:hypothetical protein
MAETEEAQHRRPAQPGAHKGATPVLALQQALGHQQRQRLAQRAQRHAMLFGQRRLGRQRRAGHPFTLRDPCAQAGGQPAVAALAGRRLVGAKAGGRRKGGIH